MNVKVVQLLFHFPTAGWSSSNTDIFISIHDHVILYYTHVYVLVMLQKVALSLRYLVTNIMYIPNCNTV